MTKYIRTKDGKVYNLESKEVSSWEYIDNDTAINEYKVEGAFYSIYYFDEDEGHYSEYDDKGGHSCDFIEEKDILKQDDTIKELCDGFYLKTRRKDTGEIHIQETFIYYDDFLDEFHRIGDIEEYDIDDYWCVDGECFETELVTACGFIETDKGLIFVAKMNKDEELELI